MISKKAYNFSEKPKVKTQRRFGLLESLRTALCTNLCMKAGVSSNAVDGIYEESICEVENT